MIPFFKKFIGSGFYSGYFPLASGTAGSIVALGINLMIGLQNYSFLIPLIIFSFLIGIPLGSYFEELYGKDPKQFTFDEFVGTWIAFLFTPNSFLFILATFSIWRILDIYKPFPVNRAEELKGGLGIMLDDVLSGMYSLIIIYIFKLIFF